MGYRRDGGGYARGVPRGAVGSGVLIAGTFVFRMATHEIGHETASRHDPEAAARGVVESVTNELRADPLALALRWNLRMGEDQLIALLPIDGYRETVFGVAFVTTPPLVVPRARCAIRLGHQRSTSQNFEHDNCIRPSDSSTTVSAFAAWASRDRIKDAVARAVPEAIAVRRPIALLLIYAPYQTDRQRSGVRAPTK